MKVLFFFHLYFAVSDDWLLSLSFEFKEMFSWFRWFFTAGLMVSPQRESRSNAATLLRKHEQVRTRAPKQTQGGTCTFTWAHNTGTHHHITPGALHLMSTRLCHSFTKIIVTSHFCHCHRSKSPPRSCQWSDWITTHWLGPWRHHMTAWRPQVYCNHGMLLLTEGGGRFFSEIFHSTASFTDTAFGGYHTKYNSNKSNKSSEPNQIVLQRISATCTGGPGSDWDLLLVASQWCISS